MEKIKQREETGKDAMKWKAKGEWKERMMMMMTSTENRTQ